MGIDKLEKLCSGVRAIAPGVEIRIKPSEAEAGQWSVIVAAGDAILVYTEYGPLDASLSIALSKLASISQRMMAAVRQAPSEPPPSRGDGDGERGGQ